MYESGVQETVWAGEAHFRVTRRYIYMVHKATGLGDAGMACQHSKQTSEEDREESAREAVPFLHLISSGI